MVLRKSIIVVYVIGLTLFPLAGAAISVSAETQTISIETLQELRSLVPFKPDSIATLLEANLDEIYRSKNRDAIEQSYYLLGLSYYFKGQYLISNYYYDRLLNMDGVASNLRIMEAVYNNKGVNLELLGQFESAIEVYLQSQNFAEMREDTLGIGQSKLNLGVLFHQLRDTTKAVEFVGEALDYFKIVDDQYHVALGNMNYGTYIYNVRPDEGQIYLDNALELFKQFDDRYRIAETLYHQATVLYMQANYENAFQKALESLQYQSPDIYNNLKINTITAIIGSLAELGRNEEAIPWIDEVNRVVEEKKTTAIESLNYFWDNAEQIFENLERQERLTYQKEMKRSFQVSIDSMRFDAILQQYQFLSEMSGSYADSIGVEVDLLAGLEDSNRVVIFFGAGVFLLLIAGGFFFYRQKILSQHPSQASDFIVQKLEFLNQKSEEDTPDQHQSASYTDNPFSQLFIKIDEYMMAQKLYKKTELSRNYLAKNLHTNTKYISQAIKQETGLSFNDYINSCAIAEAVTLMEKHKNSLTNQEIAERCGYPSESSFYRNFKKFTNMTPAQFRLKLQRSKKVAS